MKTAVAFLMALGATGAEAAPPTGYQCAPGKARTGSGCDCPTTHDDKRDAENTAVCVKKPDLYDGLISKATKLVESGCDAAVPVYEKALEVRPTGIEALVGLGRCALDKKNYSTAMNRFRSAQTVSPKSEPALSGIAETFETWGRRTDAIAAWKAYLEVFPTATKAKRALAKLEAMVEKEPPEPKRDPSKPPKQPEKARVRTAPSEPAQKAIYGRLKVAMERHDLLEYAAARKELTAALAEARKAKVETAPIVADVYLMLAIVDLGSGDPRAAKADLIDALRIDQALTIWSEYRTATLDKLLDEAKRGK